MHLAAGQGILDACQVLVDYRANVMGVNARGKGILELAKGSPSTRAWLSANTRARETTGESRGQRVHDSQARLIRHALAVRKTSAASAEARGKGKGKGKDKGKDKGKGKKGDGR